MQYVVYKGNSSYFFFFVIGCFSEDIGLLFVLLFFLTLVCIVTTSFEKLELQCQKRLPQINVIVPIRLKLKLYAVFIKWGSWINFLFMRRQAIVNNWDFPSKISGHRHMRLAPKIVVWHDHWKMFKKASSWPTGLSSRFSWNDFLLFTTATHLFFQSFLSHTLGSRFESFSTANNLSSFWCSKHVSTYAFCCSGDIFTQRRNCSSANDLCKSPKSPSLLSSNRSIVWNFYLPWSNNLVVS